MKKTMYPLLLICSFALATLMLASCNGGEGANNTGSNGESKGGEIDYQMLEKKEAVSKWYEEIADKLGAHKSKTDEIDISISRPSKEGLIKRKGEPDNLMISISYQDPNDKNKVMHQVYNSRSGWGKAESKELQVMSPGKETFSLSDELFDFSAVSSGSISKVMADALATKKDPKYKEQYISNCRFNKDGFNVTIKGRLALNDQESSETYYADLQGNGKP